VLRQDWSTLGFSGWLHLRWMNLLYTFGDGVPKGGGTWLWLTNVTLFSPAWACGVVCLLVPLALLPSWRSRGNVSAQRMIVAGLVASGIWLGLEYGPPKAPPWTHQGPYAAFLLVGVGAVALFVMHANRWLVAAAVAVQGAFWAQAWWPRGTILNCAGPCEPSLQKMVNGYDRWTVRPWIALVVVVGVALFWWSARALGRDYDTSSSTVMASPSTVPAAAPAPVPVAAR
jgi:hypothetical protein